MTRREMLILVRNGFVFCSLGMFFCQCGCSWIKKNDVVLWAPSIALLLGYFLYGDEMSPETAGEMETQLNAVAQKSFRKKRELESLYNRLTQKSNGVSFDALSPENKEAYCKAILPLLGQSPVVTEILRCHLEGERVLRYLDYPDLPGDFGECGWLVLEGEIWDRYYGK